MIKFHVQWYYKIALLTNFDVEFFRCFALCCMSLSVTIWRETITNHIEPVTLCWCACWLPFVHRVGDSLSAQLYQLRFVIIIIYHPESKEKLIWVSEVTILNFSEARLKSSYIAHLQKQFHFLEFQSAHSASLLNWLNDQLRVVTIEYIILVILNQWLLQIVYHRHTPQAFICFPLYNRSLSLRK